MDVPIFEFTAGDWFTDGLDCVGFPAIVLFDGEEIWRSANACWTTDDAIETAREHFVATMQRVLRETPETKRH